ncbi:transcription factor bHLH118 [Cryptomeria japonica]|uniref:transcription factor bHLH118 n=1 Tax=Cryptomeria japonica TaxID=3369 RepID=UPI0027DA73C9|nr:transcription factor bHLH118 [Cryptomeria japonica]
MEMNDSELFPSPIFENAGDICAYNDSTLRKSPNQFSLSRNPLKISGVVDYETRKLDCKFIEPGLKIGKAQITSKNSIHTSTERQRRKDMKSLYSSLRSLLPEEYVMGKRSIADQLLRTANYIKHLQEKVKEAKQVRDETCQKKMCQDLPVSVASQTFPSIKIDSSGSFIVVSTINCQIAFSDLLFAMENNDLHVVSASSCAMNDKFFHTVHAKVSDLNNFDKRILYRQISNLMTKIEKKP